MKERITNTLYELEADIDRGYLDEQEQHVRQLRLIENTFDIFESLVTIEDISFKEETLHRVYSILQRYIK